MVSITYFAVVLACITAIAAQDCGITGVTDNTVVVQGLKETTPEGTVIWSQETYNVVATAAISNPMIKYINGLRYSTKYEYVAADIFPTFVQTERASSIRRDVIFTCADGATKPYTFIFEIEDENTEAPMFLDREYKATVSKSDNSTEPNNANIVVSDGDYEEMNAKVVIRSSNALVTPFINPIWEGEYPDSYIYRMDFLVSQTLAVGTYQIILTADDGMHADAATFALTVTA